MPCAHVELRLACAEICDYAVAARSLQVRDARRQAGVGGGPDGVGCAFRAGESQVHGISCAMSPLALTVFTMSLSKPSDVSARAANLLPPRYGSSQGTRLLPAKSCTDAAEPTSHTNAWDTTWNTLFI